MKNSNRTSSCLLTMLSILVILNIAGIKLLRHYDYFYRSIPLASMDKLESELTCETPQNLKDLCGSTYQDTLKNIMDFVPCSNASTPSSEHVQSFFDCAKQGGILNCNGMAELYLHALRLQNIRARKIFVVKNFGDPYQSHTLVEIFIEGKWRIFDPTFHVSFEKNGELIGAQEIAKSLIDGSFNQIKPIFYGEVAYPHRLETYYMHWLSLYNNVLIFKPNAHHGLWIKKLLGLPLRYWHGPVLYYFSQDGRPNNYLELLNSIYFLIIFAIPLSIGLLVFLLMLTMLMVLLKKRNSLHKKG